MKNYFNFNLTGKKLFPIWMTFFVTFIIPYIALIFITKEAQNNPLVLSRYIYLMPLLVIMLIVVAFAVMFFAAKLIIESVLFRGQSVKFTGSSADYFGTILKGFVLSSITFGVYFPWFIRDLHRFFIDNTSYSSNALEFQGKGGKLFKILLLTVFLPMILLFALMVKIMLTNPSNMESIMVVQQAVTMLIMIPYMYLVYKWCMDIKYKNYSISWDTNFWNSCGKIALEIFLTIITLGIYMPMAHIKLYKYFADKTTAVSDERTLKFGYDIDEKGDFLFIGKHLLLTIITLGVYYPWAISEIGNRIIVKTYLVEEAKA